MKGIMIENGTLVDVGEPESGSELSDQAKLLVMRDAITTARQALFGVGFDIETLETRGEIVNAVLGDDEIRDELAILFASSDETDQSLLDDWTDIRDSLFAISERLLALNDELEGLSEAKSKGEIDQDSDQDKRLSQLQNDLNSDVVKGFARNVTDLLSRLNA